MHDLNDLYYFAMVVDHGGFAAAERALGIPKSRLSRRISQLETDLGVRLLQRSTRRFAVTDVGTSVHRHAQTMLAEAQAAREVVDRLSAEPRGLVRVSVPVSLAQIQLPKLLPQFLANTRRCGCSSISAIAASMSSTKATTSPCACVRGWMTTAAW